MTFVSNKSGGKTNGNFAAGKINLGKIKKSRQYVAKLFLFPCGGQESNSVNSEHQIQLTTVLSHDICCDYFENKNRQHKNTNNKQKTTNKQKKKKHTNRQTDRQTDKQTNKKTFSKILCGGLSSNLLRKSRENKTRFL